MEDIDVPSECESVASTGDHLLLEYSVFFRNGTAGAYVKRPSQLVHVLLDSKVRVTSIEIDLLNNLVS